MKMFYFLSPQYINSFPESGSRRQLVKVVTVVTTKVVTRKVVTEKSSYEKSSYEKSSYAVVTRFRKVVTRFRKVVTIRSLMKYSKKFVYYSLK